MLKESNLVKHAKRELEIAGMFSRDSDYEGELGKGVMKLIKEFASQGHSGGSAMITLAIFGKLARFQNLEPITDDPKDWEDVSDMWEGEEVVHQCLRNGALFSKDGGKTYYSVDGDDKRIKKSDKHK